MEVYAFMFYALGSVSVIFLRYDSIGPLLKPTSDPGVTDYSRYAAAGDITVCSPVIAAAVTPPAVFPLDHVTFTLRHSEVCSDLTLCVYTYKLLAQTIA